MTPLSAEQPVDDGLPHPTVVSASRLTGVSLAAMTGNASAPSAASGAA